MNLTAEQRAARIERDIDTSRRFAAVYTQAAKREIARIAELERILADLDSKQVTPRQIERVAPCPYCHSPLKVSDERYPARRLSEAELAELDEMADEPAEASPCA